VIIIIVIINFSKDVKRLQHSLYFWNLREKGWHELGKYCKID